MATRLFIRGRVQGVGFRYSMASQAERLGVLGWVRNRRDGSVEAVVDGTREAVEAIVAWAKVGPRGAQVSAVETSDAAGTFTRFDQLPTE